MSIKNVLINNKKKCLEIETPKGTLRLPFAKLRLIPTADNKIKEAYLDEELGNTAVTYVLESGEEDTIHLDAFLDYNKDPEYMRKMTLYKLTLNALEIIKVSRLSKREIVRKLNTSPSQLYRLLDTANYSKTIDQMVKLLTSLGFKIEFTAKEDFLTDTVLNKAQVLPDSKSIQKLVPYDRDFVAGKSWLPDEGELSKGFPVLVEKYGTDQLTKFLKEVRKCQPLMVGGC